MPLIPSQSVCVKVSAAVSGQHSLSNLTPSFKVQVCKGIRGLGLGWISPDQRSGEPCLDADRNYTAHGDRLTALCSAALIPACQPCQLNRQRLLATNHRPKA